MAYLVLSIQDPVSGVIHLIAANSLPKSKQGELRDFAKAAALFVGSWWIAWLVEHLDRGIVSGVLMSALAIGAQFLLVAVLWLF